jgi:hypothetical protein
VFSAESPKMKIIFGLKLEGIVSSRKLIASKINKKPGE